MSIPTESRAQQTGLKVSAHNVFKKDVKEASNRKKKKLGGFWMPCLLKPESGFHPDSCSTTWPAKGNSAASTGVDDPPFTSLNLPKDAEFLFSTHDARPCLRIKLGESGIYVTRESC